MVISRWKWLAMSAILGSFVYMYLDEKLGNRMFSHVIKISSAVYANMSSNDAPLTSRTGFIFTSFRTRAPDLSTGYRSLSHRHLPNLTSMARNIHFTVPNDNSECADRRYIVYTCRHGCGGWGDRLKGITSLFLLAQLTNRTFLIDMPTPCNLKHFVLPNMYEWDKCLSASKQVHKDQTTDLTLMSPIKMEKINELVNGSLKQYQVIRIQSNSIVIETIKKHPLANLTMPWLHTLAVAEVTGSIIGNLFKPTENITSEIWQFYEEKVQDKRLVCSHIRYGRSSTIPTDTSLRDGPPNVTAVLHFLKTYDNTNNVIFVATDSNSVRNQSKTLLTNFISTEKQIVHIDKTKRGTDKSCQGFLTAILEHVILSTCDVLVLTRSNFGAMAAYMRGHSKNIFLHFKEREDIFNVTLSGIHTTYKFV